MSWILAIIIRTTFIWSLDTSRFMLLTWRIRRMRTSSSDTFWTTLSSQKSLLSTLLKSRKSSAIVNIIWKILYYKRPRARSNINCYIQNDNLLETDKLCLDSKNIFWRGREDFQDSTVSIIFVCDAQRQKSSYYHETYARTPLSSIFMSFRSSRHDLKIWETSCSDKVECSRMIDKDYYHNVFTKSIYDDITKERKRSTAPYPEENWTYTQFVSKVFVSTNEYRSVEMTKDNHTTKFVRCPISRTNMGKKKQTLETSTECSMSRRRVAQLQFLITYYIPDRHSWFAGSQTFADKVETNRKEKLDD